MHRSGKIDNKGLPVQDIIDPFGRCQSLLVHAVNRGQLLDGTQNADQRCQEKSKYAKGHLSFKDRTPADPEHDHNSDRGQHFTDRREHQIPPYAFHERLVIPLVDLGKPVDFMLFTGECLDDRHPMIRFRENRVQIRHGLLRINRLLLDRLADGIDQKPVDRKNNQHNKDHFPAYDKSNGREHDRQEELVHHISHAVGDRLSDERRIIGDARHELALPLLAVKIQG